MESFTIRAMEFRLQKCLLGWLVSGDSACQRLKPQHLHHQPATSATLVALVLGMPKVGYTTSSFSLLGKYLTISKMCPAADVAGVRQGVISSRRDKISTDQTNLIKQTTLSKVYTLDAPTPNPLGPGLFCSSWQLRCPPTKEPTHCTVQMLWTGTFVLTPK